MPCVKCGDPVGKTPTGRDKKHCDPCHKEVRKVIHITATAKYKLKKAPPPHIGFRTPRRVRSVVEAELYGIPCIPLQKLFERRTS